MKKMIMGKKRVITIATAVMMTLMFCLAGSVAADDINKQLVKSSIIDKVMRKGKLRVGLASFVPWAMQDKKGEWIGFEIDVAKQLAKDMGVEIEFVPTKWEGLIPSLLTGKFDMIIAGMTGTPQRALKINFTNPLRLFRYECRGPQEFCRRCHRLYGSGQERQHHCITCGHHRCRVGQRNLQECHGTVVSRRRPHGAGAPEW